MPWRRWLVACTCLLPRRSGFDPRQVHAIFIVDKVKRGQIFLRVLRFSPVNIIPPVPHTQLHVTLTRRTNGRSLIIFQEQCAFGNSWSLIRSRIHDGPDTLIWRCPKGAKITGARPPWFCTVALNICGSSASNLLLVTLLAPRILGGSENFGRFEHPADGAWAKFNILYLCQSSQCWKEKRQKTRDIQHWPLLHRL